MLTDEQLMLITVAVDGDLTDAEARALQRLLNDSPEARRTYDQLRTDSIRLQSLSRLEPPADLRARVMAQIAALAPSVPPALVFPAELTQKPFPRRRAAWMPIAVAASVMLAIASASFLFFRGEPERAPLARNPHRPPPATQDGAADPRWAKRLPPESGRLPSAPMPSERHGKGVVHEAPPPGLGKDGTVAVAPEPRSADRDFLGAHPRAEFPDFDLVQLRLPFLEALAEFERDSIRQHLIEELGRDPAFRVDLFARNTARAVELFQKAARASRLTIHADANSLNHLRKGHVSSIVIYTESLGAAELTELLGRLNTEDARVSPRVFDAVHATPIGREDEIEIRRVLGIDPGLFKRGEAAPGRWREVPKGGSVTAGTADEIADSITSGKGRAEGASAVLLTWAPAAGRTPPGLSAELKTYLSKRGKRKSDAVPAIIVIRHGNG